MPASGRPSPVVSEWGRQVSEKKVPRINILENGPYRVFGANLVRMKMSLSPAGRPVDWRQGPLLEEGTDYELCRCGASSNKPYCDWSHVSAGFDGAETASRRPTLSRQKLYPLQGLTAADDKSLCIHAGFCVTEKTDFWELAEHANNLSQREELKRMIRNCPSGRLEYREGDSELPVEETLPREIGVIENGPLYVRGRIVVESADGGTYEVRNRITLCRCGASRNKPFCDGKHTDVGFRDGK